MSNYGDNEIEVSHLQKYVVENSVEGNFPSNQLGPSGIGGWLILLIMGYLLSIVRTFSNFSEVMALFESYEYYFVLEAVANKFLYQLFIVYEVLASIGLICYIIVLLVFMIKKELRYPVFASALYLISIASLFIEMLLYYSLFGEIDSILSGSLIQALVTAAIWVTYFKKSTRVKNTFGRNGLFS